MIFNDRPGDINALMAQASAVLNAHTGNTASNVAANTAYNGQPENTENASVHNAYNSVHTKTVRNGNSGNASETMKKTFTHDKGEVGDEIAV